MKASMIIPRPAVITLTLLALAVTLAVPLSANGMYDPKHGRWLQRDPLGMKLDHPTPGPGPQPRPAPQDTTPDDSVVVVAGDQYRDGMNLYQYVGSRPSLFVDPDGTVIVTISGFGQSPSRMNKIGQAIKKKVTEAFRKNGIEWHDIVIPLGGGGQGPEDELIREFRDFALRKFSPCEQFVAVGHSDGATAIYHFVRDGKNYVAGSEEAPAYLGLIDMVRREYVLAGPNGLNYLEDNWISDMGGGGQLTLIEAFHQEDDYVLWWRGYHFVHAVTNDKKSGGHLGIIKNKSLIDQIAKNAAFAYYDNYLWRSGLK